jgi:hypothetical protein
MCADASDRDLVPSYPLDAVDNASLPTCVLEAASLLDVQFEVSTQRVEAVVGIMRAKVIDP